MPDINTYLFTQGVLGVACFILGFVVVYQQKKADKKDDAHAEEVRGLNRELIAASNAHALDYRELAKDNQEVMSNTSQNVRILSEKIEVGKARGH